MVLGDTGLLPSCGCTKILFEHNNSFGRKDSMYKTENDDDGVVFPYVNPPAAPAEDSAAKGLHHFESFVKEAKLQDEKAGINYESYRLVIPEKYSNSGQDEVFEIPVPDADKFLMLTDIDANNVKEWLAVLFNHSADDYIRFSRAMQGISPTVLMLFLNDFMAWWQPKVKNMPDSLPKLKG